MHNSRLEALRKATREVGLNAIAVVPGPNLEYLTGLHFHLSERITVLFVPVEGGLRFVVPALERTKAEGLPFDTALHAWTDEDGPAAALGDAAAALSLGGARLGVEGRRIRFLELDALARSGHAPSTIDADPVFASLRMRKSEAELSAMRQAIAIAEGAFEAIMPMIRVGVTEGEIASALFVEVMKGGSGAPPFMPIVAAGVNGANPHAAPGDTHLAAGDIVTIDWGATHSGYASDITRCIAVAGADPDGRLLSAYTAVRDANAAGRAAARPGATGQDVDRATRAVIQAAGLGEYFIHRTGHGLGLETHEEPDMKEGSLVPLAPGMTFTIEPGVYIPDLGGMRVEDDVVITVDGAETLTTLSRELVTVG